MLCASTFSLYLIFSSMYLRGRDTDIKHEILQAHNFNHSTVRLKIMPKPEPREKTSLNARTYDALYAYDVSHRYSGSYLLNCGNCRALIN